MTGLTLMLGLAGLTVAFAATGNFPLTPVHKSSAARAFGVRAGGSLSIVNSLEGQAILNASGMQPGESRAGSVSITNSGNIDGYFTLLDSAISDTGSTIPFSTVAQLLIQDTTNPALPLTIYAGPLGGLAPIALGQFSPNETRDYQFTVTFPVGTPAHDNQLQGARTTLEYDWVADDGTTPTDPTDPGSTTATTSPTETTGPVTGATSTSPPTSTTTQTKPKQTTPKRTTPKRTTPKHAKRKHTKPTTVTSKPVPKHAPIPGNAWKVKLTAPLRRRLRSGRVIFQISCGRACYVGFGGTIKIPPIRRRYKISHVNFGVPAGAKISIVVKLSPSMKAGMLRALRQHKRPTMTAQVTARSGKLRAKATRTVRIVR